MAIEGSKDSSAPRRLRLGMVGGGRGAFIGAVHRIAARLDDRWELVAGALSADPERAIASAADLHIPADRAYATYTEMAAAEAKRADKIDAVAIVTPNHMHFGPAKTFLEAGINVICDKPLTSTLDDALALEKIVADSGAFFGLTHNYTAHPLIRQARAMVANGELGDIRVVQVEYPQDWLATKLEDSGQKQAAWRTDPARSGAAGSVGDIGTHAFNLAEFVTGQQVEALAADLSSLVGGRALDDNAGMLLRFASGARGMLWASQVAIGNENNVRLRIYGSKASLDWWQEQPNWMTYSVLGQPPQTIRRGGSGSNDAAGYATRVPAGHPEGYLEAFAQLYRDFAEQISARLEGREPHPQSLLAPGIAAGVRGMRFITAAVASSRANAGWTKI